VSALSRDYALRNGSASRLRSGIGSRLLADVIERGRLAKKPVRLGVVKINPAVRLYERHGFTITSEDDFKFYMEKRPA
jgi:ribosomal protein S18 acetylase RimI-like enzyme